MMKVGKLDGLAAQGMHNFRRSQPGAGSGDTTTIIRGPGVRRRMIVVVTEDRGEKAGQSNFHPESSLIVIPLFHLGDSFRVAAIFFD